MPILRNLRRVSPAYQVILEKIGQSASKFDDFRILHSLDQEDRDKFLTLYRIVKLWEETKGKEILTRDDVLKAIKQYAPPGKALLFFKDYFRNFQRALFETSREWKKTFDKGLSERVVLLKKELSTLKAMIGRYRDMVLRTDPVALWRTASFTEWIVGPEPRKTKELHDLVYTIEKWTISLINLSKPLILGRKTRLKSCAKRKGWKERSRSTCTK